MSKNWKVLKDKNGTPDGTLVTPMFRGAYVKLFTPEGIKGDPNSKKKYSIAMLFPKDTDFEPLKTVIKAVAIAEWGDKAEKILREQQNDKKRIFKDQGSVEAAGFEEGCVFIQASNEKKPGLVGGKAGPDGSLMAITDEEAVWSGDYFLAAIRPFAWNHATGKGVSLSLQLVQLVKKGERLGGGRTRASDAFEAYEEADITEAGGEDVKPMSKDPFA